MSAHETPLHLALELLEHDHRCDPGLQRRARHGGLLGAVQALQEREQTVQVEASGASQRIIHAGSLPRMGLADQFQEIIDSFPSDWTQLELDLRVDEERYIEAATFMVQCNAQPYSRHDWHFRILVAHQFGHAAAVPAVRTSLKLLDQSGIAGELVLRELREGHVEVVNHWGRPESVRQEFRRIRAQ